ncbi:MAG: penicillin-binding protein activator [Novosphingobium sp.]|nr:penicillin-binding protein activator [Novosphingobium sp.]
MFGDFRGWRKLAVLGASSALAACSVVPKAPPPAPPPVVGPSPDVLPTDTERHRVALLVPTSGPNAAVGQSIANAATMALLDTNATNLRVTTYDTAANPGEAAQRAVRDGNRLILGPLLSSEIGPVRAVAEPVKVPLISFSNDETAATRNIFLMGHLPGQSVTRVVTYAAGQGVKTFAAVVPRGDYGQRASDALMAAAKQSGSSVQAMETYDRSNASLTAAAKRIVERGGYSAVLIADGGRLASQAAPVLKPAAGSTPRIIGTELWSGEKIITSTKALDGAWFAAVADNRFAQFSSSYRKRFGANPYRLATLGYDAVLLSLRIAREWKPGSVFPIGKLSDKGGFLGLDGPFRFSRNGVIERALEVREIRSGTIVTVSPAPTRFED